MRARMAGGVFVRACAAALGVAVSAIQPAMAEQMQKSALVQYEPYDRFGTCFSALTLLNELSQMVTVALDSIYLDRDGAVIGDPSFRFRNVAPGQVVADDQPFRNLPCAQIGAIRYRVSRCEVDGQRTDVAFCADRLSFENRAVIGVTIDGLTID